MPPRLSGPQVGSDLLLHRLLDRVDLVQLIDVLIHLLGMSSDVPRTRSLLSLHQEEIGIVPCHNESESEADVIGMLEREYRTA